MPLRIRKEVQDMLKASLDGAPEALRTVASEAGAAPLTPEQAVVETAADTPAPKERHRKAKSNKKAAIKPSRKPAKRKPALRTPVSRKTVLRKTTSRKRTVTAAPPGGSTNRRKPNPPIAGTAIGFRDFSGEIETIRTLFDMLIINSAEPARLMALKSLTERYLSETPSQEKLDQVRLLLQRQAVIIKKERRSATGPVEQVPAIDLVATPQPAAEAQPMPDRVRRGEVDHSAKPAEPKAAGPKPAEPAAVPPLPPEAKRRNILAWFRRGGGSGGGGGGKGAADDPANQGRSISAQIKTVLMATVWLGVGTATLTYAGALIYVNYMRLETDSALISGNVEPVNAPIDGSITTLFVRPGDRLAEGQRFVVLEDPEVEKLVRLAGVKVDRAREEMRLKQAELESERLKRDEYVAISRNMLEKINSDIAALEQLEKVARERFDRLTDLFKKGIVIRPRVEEASDKLAEHTTQLAKARINKREREAQMDGVLAGQFFDGNQVVGKLREAEAAVARASAEIDLALEELQTMQQRRQINRITASHESRVLKVLRNEGASVKRGDTMLVIERLDERMVHAFLRQEEINRVAIGDEATVYVPSLRAKATARVTHVDRNAAFLDDVDARYSWKIARDGGPKPTDKDRTARVTLRFEGSDKEVVDGKFELGMPTVVSFPRRSVSTVFSNFADVGRKL